MCLDIKYSIVNEFKTNLVNVIFVILKLIIVSYVFSTPNSNMLLQLLSYTQFLVTQYFKCNINEFNFIVTPSVDFEYS